ncbi:hypothetical protein [Rossellomorea aquimaris]|nr:hypothetical protein [Rossellomorea aquimaris]
MKVGWNVGFENKWWGIENNSESLKISMVKLKIKPSLHEQDE